METFKTQLKYMYDLEDFATFHINFNVNLGYYQFRKLILYAAERCCIILTKHRRVTKKRRRTTSLKRQISRGHKNLKR